MGTEEDVFSPDFGESIPPTPPLFVACDGIQFYGAKDELFTIHAGVYPTGNGALQISSGGEAYCKLTVNMAEVVNESTVRKGSLADDEFYVRVEEVGPIERFVLDTGFFKQTGYYADAGFVRRYADLWTFARCTDDRHIRNKEGLYCVTCLSCLDKHRRSLDEVTTRVQAREAIRRLQSMPKGSL